MFSNSKCTVLLVIFCLSSLSHCFSQDAAQKLSWKELVDTREKSFSKLRELYQTAQKASPAERQELAKEFTAISTRLQVEIFPQLEANVYEQLEANPKDEKTLEIANELMEYLYGKNDYSATKRLSEAVLRVDPQNDSAVNFAGVANFAEQDFENSNRILNLAKKNGQLLGELGGQYLNTSKLYIEYWKKEKAIRVKEDAAEGDAQLPRVKFVTSRGEIVLELFENEAPNTVANFISLVEKKFYDGLAFHRVLPNFMAQGGCPFSKTNPDRAGSGGPGYNIDCEAYRPDARRHFSGSLSMAHAGKNTGGSQFFITHLPTPHLDREINPDSVHTVFGRVIEGLDVVRKIQPNDVIEAATVIRKRNHDYVPVTGPER